MYYEYSINETVRYDTMTVCEMQFEKTAYDIYATIRWRMQEHTAFVFLCMEGMWLNRV